MNKIEFNHKDDGVELMLNGINYGLFDNEKDAVWYLILNKLIDTIVIIRYT